MSSPLARFTRPHPATEPPPLAVPVHLADAAHGLLLLRSGPAGPDIADLNRWAAALLGAPAPELLGTLLVDCPLLARTPGLLAAVDLVTRGGATWWRTVVRAGSGTVAVMASPGPIAGSAALRLLSVPGQAQVCDVA